MKPVRTETRAAPAVWPVCQIPKVVPRPFGLNQ